MWPIYVLAAVGAAVGAFDLPARQALLPTLVPREHLPNAISLNTIMFQTASVLGPGARRSADRGDRRRLDLRRQRHLVRLRDCRAADDARRPGAREPSDGRRGTICLIERGDGGTAIRVPLAAHPIDDAARFLRDVLRLGDGAAADLRAGHPAASARTATAGCSRRRRSGAFVTSVALVPLVAHIKRRGASIVWSVAGHGAATVVFGLSRSFWLTFACLALVGATDTVSTVLRNVIRHLETPDRLRGRMTGINMVFFMGGPQLGELEAGAVANWFGAPFSVITGGIGCLLATAWVAATTPGLRALS